jgi:hypothetical protein
MLGMKTASSAWRNAMSRLCDERRREPVYMHRDFLGTLDPVVFRIVTAVKTEPVTRPARSGSRDFEDLVDEWGAQSFPASDPPSNW